MTESAQLAYRAQKELDILEAAPTYERLQRFEKPSEQIRCSCYSPCGNLYIWATANRVTVVNTSSGQVIFFVEIYDVFDLGASPLGSYISTWQRPSKNSAGEGSKNLKVWKLPQKDEIAEASIEFGEFVQKSATAWHLQYTDDEKLCARAVSNEIQIYQSCDLRTIWRKIRVEGVADIALAPGPKYRVAAFVPERKGLPANVKIFDIDQPTAPVSQKNFFKGDKVQFKWNLTGSSLLVLAQTEVDKSGKSYYGETTLYLMSAAGGFESRVELDKEGPIHDVAWSPSSSSFGVVYGYMPAKTTIFNLKATAVHSFPLGPRNFLMFSPHAKFILIAGFGNLAGQMDVFDLQNNYKRMCTIEASNTSVCEWSPDSSYILTATTSPRLRVDNGLKIFHASGSLVYHKALDELYQTKWRPRPASQFSNTDPFESIPTPHESALKAMESRKTPSKPAGAYRPPGARGQVTPLLFRREDEGGEALSNPPYNAQGANPIIFGRRKRDIPGAELVNTGKSSTDSLGDDQKQSRNAVKNKKKRGTKKPKDPSDFDKAIPNSSIEGDTSNIGNGMAQSHMDINIPSINEDAAKDQNQLQSGSLLQDKRSRALLKKLRAIEELKMRRTGGEKLEGTQLRKMETEEAVRSELATLGIID